MAFTLGFVSPTAHKAAMESEQQRRRTRHRMSSDISSSPTSPMSPGYNIANVVGTAAVAAAKAITKDTKPLKGPDVGPDGNVVVSNPFFAEDD